MIWQEVRKILQNRLSESVFKLWIEPLSCLEEGDGRLELAGPDRFFCNWVAENHLADIQAALQEMNREGLAVRFRVDRQAGAPEEEAGAGAEQLRLPRMPRNQNRVRTLHPRYTFDEFMVGESNALAYSACEGIATGTDQSEPCVFINAGTGLGKSHLTHAVAHHLYNNAPGTRLCCLTSQQLTAELVHHIRHNTMEQFKEKFHQRCDVLLVEDVQTLSGRNKTQVELAEAVDTLLGSGRRVLFTGSRAPREIPDLDDSVRSRLASGLVTTINPPDVKTRQLIIRRKAAYHQLQLDEEMVAYIAEKVRGDIRKVESAIVGLKAKANLRRTAPTTEMVREVVATVAGDEAPGLNSEAIRDFVAAQFKLSVEELRSKSRKKEVAFPRQVSMYLARKLTDEALAGIGKTFDRDHSTVVHSIRVINEAVARNGSVRGQIEHLTKRLRQRD
ncbi:MAG: chromosomal replication initiator protein DnaA [Desulfurivibrio sp.]|nr:chromosomal replication initiator protein DnaA [Desulfurivibrio sp.]